MNIFFIHKKLIKMQVLKMLMMTVLTILTLSVFAQDSTNQKAKPHRQQSGKNMYSCPMHPDVTSSKPGKCPKCGMKLVKSRNEHTKIYSCPMHPEVTSSKPGKCPKCDMILKEKKEDSPNK
ncbi:MAG: heavy metal-binding domain-containing protein [Ferruginibacter sp.]